MAGLALALLTAGAGAQPGQLTVKVDQPGVKISPMLYGLMTEEINHSYDGGLYAELIQNRNLKANRNEPVHWSLIQGGGGTGTMALDTARPLNAANPVSLRLNITTVGHGQSVGVANDGYWGIPIMPRTRYKASFYARAADGFTGPVFLAVETADGQSSYCSAMLPAIAAEWHQYTVTFQPLRGDTKPSTNNRFVIWAAHPGTLWLSDVSLFPPTYNNRPNGLRVDLMEKMNAMKPAFLRFPGGNYLEGNTIAERFDWKKTLGNIADRPGHHCPWGYESTDGMGLMEFLGWCEDLHMEPLLAVFAGYALRGEHIAAGPGLTPFVQDALDEIEYVTGDARSPWGARRAADGHPRPFKLQYVEIGNEDWFDRSGSYDGRYAQFYDAIKAKYPQLQLIATTGVKSRVPDVVDDHYYRSARDIERDAHHYDNHSRTGPKIFVGEWASTEGSPTPTLQAALGDAAWMTGLERNSDLVVISCYAPLLVNVNPGARQWGTNMIGYDALNSFGSPSYYVQAMFNHNRGDVVLPVTISLPETAVDNVPAARGGVGVGTWLTQAEFKDIKVTNGDTVLYQRDFATGTADWKLGAGDWKLQDGALRQSSVATDLRATVGDPAWTDYTYSLKARKLGGAEGFLFLLHAQDPDNYIWWNVGGWGNSRSALERVHNRAKSELGRSANVTVETGRWYDIRIEVRGSRIRCYLDGKLITTATDSAAAPADPIYATASRDAASGEVVLKVVNVAPTATPLQVNVQGVRDVVKTARAEVISGQPSDVNTLAEPLKVAPRKVTINGLSRSFLHEFPAHSVSVLRLKVREMGCGCKGARRLKPGAAGRNPPSRIVGGARRGARRAPKARRSRLLPK